MSRDEIAAMVSQQVQNGQAQAKLTELYEDNFKLRGDKQRLTAENEDLKGKVPAEGAVVLTGNDKTEYEAIQALGKDSKALKKIVGEHETLTGEVTALKRKTLVNEIAEAEGWKPSVLERLTQGMDLLGVEEVNEEIDDPDREGEKKTVPVKRGYFNTKDAEGKTNGKKKLAEELADFMPSLSRDDQASGERDTAERSGVVQPRMSRGDKVNTGGTKDASKKYLESAGYALPGKRGKD
jgi:hypothetical protein